MVDYNQFQAIKMQKSDKIATITMNRPEALNSVDRIMHEELEKAFEEVADDSSINVVVLTGAGKAFSSGGDFRMMKAQAMDPSLPGVTMSMAKRIITNLLEIPQPTIAAVNGDAIGLGATLALHCDIIIAAEHARFGDPHVKLGLVAGDGGALVWPLLVGPAKAKYYLLTGDLITAMEAERIGLVSKLVHTEDFKIEINELARRLAMGPTKALRWTKLVTTKRIKDEMNLGLDASLELESLSMNTKDHLEAVNAFIEKRKPQFTGQ